MVKNVNDGLSLKMCDVRNRCVEYYEELLNIWDVREADIVALWGGVRMP